jgi:hypothetical protein
MTEQLNKRFVLDICVWLSLIIIAYECFFISKAVLVRNPLEFRENAMIFTTKLLLNGENPYAFSKQPVFTNVYGILYHIIVYPFAKVFGNSFFIHRLISIIFILMSCLLIITTLKWQNISPKLSICAIAFFLYHMVRANAISAYPAAQGQFLFLCSLIIPWRMDFSVFSLFLSLVFSILAFLTKPYFIVGLPIIIIYLFLVVSKRRAVLFGGFSIIFIAFIVLLISSILPSYFINTFYANLQSEKDSINHLLNQIHDYFDETFALVIIWFFFAFKRLYNFVNRAQDLSKEYISHGSFYFFDIKHFQNPLILLPIKFMPFALIIIIMVLFKMGLHIGRFFGYFAELLTPLLIIVVFSYLENSSKSRKSVLLLCIILFNIFLTLFALPRLPNTNQKEWAEWETIITHHKHIYACPPLTHILDRCGKTLYDTGSSEYFQEAISGTPQKLAGSLQNLVNQYQKELKEKVESQYFDIIIIRKDQKPFWDINDLVSQYYFVSDEKQLPMPKKWKISIWKPKNAKTMYDEAVREKNQKHLLFRKSFKKKMGL